MTRQEMFNTVVRGIASQGWEQSVGDETCAYNGPDGRHCAVGWLIADIKIAETWNEKTSVGQLMDKYPEIEERFLGFENFLDALQRVHDEARDTAGMKNDLQNFATAHNLVWPAGL